jgi:hypothetical protein
MVKLLANRLILFFTTPENPIPLTSTPFSSLYQFLEEKNTLLFVCLANNPGSGKFCAELIPCLDLIE